MKNKLKVLIAEDTKIARELLVNNLNAFAKNILNNAEYFDIEEAESYQKSHQKIVESGATHNYYDIIFTDIDFSEDTKGGSKGSGYMLIEKAFEICPITKIATYSGQFRATELWDKYEELKNRGLIVLTFDKSHGDAGGLNWMHDGLKKIVSEIENNLFLWDIWDNHQLVLENMSSNKYASESLNDFSIKQTIISNLESIIMMLMNIDRFQGKEIIHRIIIYLYHNSLEILCRSDKTDIQIIEESDKNKLKAEEFIGLTAKGKNLKFPKEVNSQRIFVASISDYRIRFADKLNYYRNQSIHLNPTKKKFVPNLANVLISSLVFSLIVVSKKEKIETSHLESNLLKINVNDGISDLKEIINTITNRG